MCGIAGILNLNQKPREGLSHHLSVMAKLLQHRGPDNRGFWMNTTRTLGFAHNRLSIIDPLKRASQPFHHENWVITYNGEIYNYKELRKELESFWSFETNSDTEVLLALYAKYGSDCLKYCRGMFSFAIWDIKEQTLFCARDRFGIKPFYYFQNNQEFIFASEIKALLPFINELHTEPDVLLEYLTFQYTLGEKTLFRGVKQLLPAHALVIKNNTIKSWKYWDVNYEIDFSHSPVHFEERLKELLTDSVRYHLVSDVPVASYLSGGIDSSLITTLAKEENSEFYGCFHGRFVDYPGYDEYQYAKAAAKFINKPLYDIKIQPEDFINNIEKIIYHLDVPMAGPGAFPQYMVSKLASEHVKVVLGGQGGDEIFGGYARYLIAYFEQSIKAAIEGTYKNGNFVVTPESIIPNLTLLQEYKPLLKKFWSEGLFGPLDERYFRLIDRSIELKDEIHWEYFQNCQRDLINDFKAIFNNHENVKKEAYFDKMTHFDFKCSLPALLHVEDRMSMAHGLESRVPFLDHTLVEFAATIPADIKFPGGKMKNLLKESFKTKIPENILNRRDKMGFPVPLKEWLSGPIQDFIKQTFSNAQTKNREFYNYPSLMNSLESNDKFSRKMWGLLSLELWHQIFHDRHAVYKSLLNSDIHNTVEIGA